MWVANRRADNWLRSICSKIATGEPDAAMRALLARFGDTPMKSAHIFPLATTLSLAMLGACSKPAPAAVDEAATTTAAATSDAAAATANAASGPTEPGGVVSPPQANDAVNTDDNATATDTAAASNSFTEGQAKGHIENAGYTDVTGLTKTPDGMWTAKATKGGKAMDVAVDFKGAVTAR